MKKKNKYDTENPDAPLISSRESIQEFIKGRFKKF